MQNRVDLNIELQALLRFDEDAWLAWCPSLDISSQAESQDQALQALQEAVQLWFESCLERGVLREALLETNFKLAHSGAKSQNQVSIREKNEIERPIEVKMPAYVAAELQWAANGPN